MFAHTYQTANVSSVLASHGASIIVFVVDMHAKNVGQSIIAIVLRAQMDVYHSCRSFAKDSGQGQD